MRDEIIKLMKISYALGSVDEQEGKVMGQEEQTKTFEKLLNREAFSNFMEGLN